MDKKAPREKKTFKTLIVGKSTAVIFWGALLITAAAYLFWLSPLLDTYQQVQVQIIDLRSRLTQRQAELKDLRDMEATYNTLETSKIDIMESLISPGVDLPRLYVRFDRLVTSMGLTMDSINAQVLEKIPADAPQDLGIVQIRLKLSQADYGKIKRFLTALENSAEIMDVTRVSWPEKMDSLDVELNTYYLK